MSSLLPTPEPPDPVEGALGHFEHSNWVKASLKALDAGTVHNTGGSAGALGVAELLVDSPASQDANIRLRGDDAISIWSETATGLARWREILGDSTAETGSHSGSLYKLNAYADDGTLRHTVLQADRASGMVTVRADPTEALGIATKQYVDNGMPIGAIIAYGGATAPAGWHLCNGTAHGSSALQAVIGSANTPDLSGRFIVGAGTGYNPGSTGGAASVTLTGAESGTSVHSHAAASGGASNDHTHVIDPPNTASGGQSADHSHYVDLGGGGHGHPHYASNLLSAEGDFNPAGSGHQFLIGTGATIGGGGHGHAGQSGGASANHSHTVNIPAFTSEGQSATHSHAITITAAAAANAAAAHENRPPYYALVYIIRKG